MKLLPLKRPGLSCGWETGRAGTAVAWLTQGQVCGDGVGGALHLRL